MFLHLFSICFTLAIILLIKIIYFIIKKIRKHRIMSSTGEEFCLQEVPDYLGEPDET